MSMVYVNNPNGSGTRNDLYTGGHDGALVCWNFETGAVRHCLHEKDPTCMASGKSHIKQSKSVDVLVVMEKRKKLISISADSTLRFWSLTENAKPTFVYKKE